MDPILNLLLLLVAFSPLELNGAAVTHQITPSHPESTSVHIGKEATTVATIKQSRFAETSQEPNTFAVATTDEAKTATYTVMHRNRQETPTEPISKSMNPTIPRTSPPLLLQTESNTENPKSTSEIEMNTNKTVVLDGTVSTDPRVLNTTISQPTPTAEMSSTHRFSTYATSENPKPTTASTLGHVSTTLKSTMKITTRKTAPPVKPKTTPAKDQPSETHGIVAAVLISLIFLMMFAGIFFIMVKKRIWRRRQLENSEWAGPSPFLDGSTQPHFSGDRDSTKAESKRISIVGFLPRHDSKNGSLLDDTDEGLDMDVLAGTTFGQSSAVETKPVNGTFQEKKEDAENEQDHNSAQSASDTLQMTADVSNPSPNPESALIKEDDNPEVNLKETPSVQPPPTTTTTNTPPPPPSDTNLQSSDETTPASDVQIPPAPPLPQS